MRSMILFLVLCASAAAGDTGSTTAQADAEWMASRGSMCHRGTARCVEGVGMASTKDGAIRRCCYWGQRKAREIGAALGKNGRWYACVRYW